MPAQVYVRCVKQPHALLIRARARARNRNRVFFIITYRFDYDYSHKHDFRSCHLKNNMVHMGSGG